MYFLPKALTHDAYSGQVLKRVITYYMCVHSWAVDNDPRYNTSPVYSQCFLSLLLECVLQTVQNACTFAIQILIALKVLNQFWPFKLYMLINTLISLHFLTFTHIKQKWFKKNQSFTARFHVILTGIPQK